MFKSNRMSKKERKVWEQKMNEQRLEQKKIKEKIKEKNIHTFNIFQHRLRQEFISLIAVMNQHVFDSFIQRGLIIDTVFSVDSEDITLLCLACRHRNVITVSLLLNAGASPNLMVNNMHPVEYLIAGNTYMEDQEYDTVEIIASLLLQHGAKFIVHEWIMDSYSHYIKKCESLNKLNSQVLCLESKIK